MTTKEKVLEILTKKQGTPISGEYLAEECGVTRAAIWKAVTGLRNQGCQIEGTTNGGYILQNTPDVFSKEAFLEYFEKEYSSLKSHVECFKEIDSTNTYAKRLLTQEGNLRDGTGALTAAGEKLHKSIIVAESQSAGRGRLGRTFYSPSKTGIYLSVIYAPKGGITEPAKLTAFSAVAICRAIKKLFNIQPQIKWINDIYLNGKKVSGILTEGFTNFETGTIESAIIGIGINISDNKEFFPEEVAKVAGSITGSSNAKVTRCHLAAEVAGQVLSVLAEDENVVLNEYKAASFLIGQTVTVHPVIGDDKTIYQAKAVDIDDSAALVVELEDGSLKHLNSGEVSLHSTAY